MRKSGQSTPEDTKGAPTSTMGTEAWIMKSLTDLRGEMKDSSTRYEKSVSDISDSVSNISTRLTTIESKISKFIWITTAAVGTLLILWSGYQFVTNFVDIDISVSTKD